MVEHSLGKGEVTSSILVISSRDAVRQFAVLSFSGGSNSVVESQPSKLLVAGSNPVSRSKVWRFSFVRLQGVRVADDV